MSTDVADVDESGGRPSEAAAAEEVVELRAKLDLLAEENQRLRAEYVRARQSQYRRAAIGLASVGLIGVAAGALLPGVRDTLLILGAIGLFGATLTYYLTPERFIAASVGRDVYGALATNEVAVADELGLSDHSVYVPLTGARPARLFVPHRSAYEVPPPDELESTFIITENPASRGLGLVPTGVPLYREFEQSTTGAVADDPAALAAQLGDAIVDVFELADATVADVDDEDGRATLRVTEPVFNSSARFDDPISSLFAVGMAVGLNTPVTAETVTTESGFVVTCNWADESEPAPTEGRDAGAADEAVPE
ncbi:hypothetical protein HUG10_07690 [Halorarum halophilum]|uniref:DUF7982 domain-containing protein n=1 Tax=Halorarum halophilum TaxID=2743090 RepID=A0A7D5KDJ6_9EURY|nr:hypothetical protein [Halobaculum halophilum]QLG27437.1 hypothetical protein HUG10_07690 [Halobaculum halophilum]